MTSRLVIGLLAFSLAATTGCATNDQDVASGQDPSRLAKPTFNADGTLNRPSQDYREWIYVGTPLTPNSLNPPAAPFPDFHNVYIHPADYEHYRETGEWQDGTVLIKELVTVGSEQAVSGKGFFMGDFIGLEATIKDAQRFADEPGNWAYFSFGHEYPLAETAEPFPAAACNACHLASAADDFVFTQYYPILRAARSPGPQGVGGSMASGSEAFDDIEDAMMGALVAAMEPTVANVTAPGAVPTADGPLNTYLQAGNYTQMPYSESGRHASAGPHTTFGLPVRVFMNAVLESSLRAGNASHPMGSEAVKEMYSADGTLEGWAVMVKTNADSDGGKGWFWYEVASVEPNAAPVASGNGVPLCFGCHSTGADYVLSDYPLR